MQAIDRFSRGAEWSVIAALGFAILGVTLMLTGPAEQVSARAPDAPQTTETRPLAADAPQTTETRPLADLLKPDGTLNLASGFRGSIDARGWRLVSGPGEAPRFVPLSVPGDESWSSNFMLGGADDGVFTIAISGTNVYAGGWFRLAGGVIANHVAKWDGSSWSALGNGLDGNVNALAVDGSGNVYAGGAFSVVCTNAACLGGSPVVNHVAKWNGSSWSALSFGLQSTVNALAVDGSGNLYAGGEFLKYCVTLACNAGDVTVHFIAKWNGFSWSAVNFGVSSPVNALAVDGSNNVYAGGDFTYVCGTALCSSGNITVNNIAKWNVIGNSWSALDNGLNAYVNELAVDSGNNVYAGGVFMTACGNSLCNSGNITVHNIAKWNGSTWSALNFGVNSYVYALAVDGSNNLYAGGFYQVCGNLDCNSGNVNANYIAKWNGSAWSVVGNGVNNSLNALAADGSGNVYAGGFHTFASGVRANRIAKWNSSSWSALGDGNGVNDTVRALAVSGSNLYAGGAFAFASGAYFTNRAARWDGSGWWPLGNGVSGTVYSLVVDGSNNVYAGGAFTVACGDVVCSSGNITVNNIGKWNGLNWSALSNGVNGNVLALVVDGSNNLYVGGEFTRVCGNLACSTGTTVNRIAKWDGISWSPSLSYGVNSLVRALAVDGSNNLYAGGAFVDACGDLSCTSLGTTMNYIAKWNGSSWSPLNNGVSGSVYSLAVDGSNNVYAGGIFAVACGNTACNSGNLTLNRIAQWNGSSWSALFNGVNNAVRALAVDGSNLYAGGSFSVVCGNPNCNSGNVTVNNIAQWNGSSWLALGSGTNDFVYALRVRGRQLYVGGDFTTAGGKLSTYIGEWFLARLYLPLIEK